MRRFLPLLCVLFAGCFQAVDPNAWVVASCSGSCPYGACDQQCSQGVDASCTTPESCLAAYSCQTIESCSAYTADRFEVGDAGTACASLPGGYCVRTVGAYGARKTYAVECSDAGAITTTDCSVPYDACDGGAQPACKAVCGISRYCVH